MIGMGGCGTVFEAWDAVLRRDVAVKVPHWSLFEKPSVRKRFGVEARAAARLSHVNIVPVHEARIDDGETCFLVSELIRGPSLEAWLAERRAHGKPVPLRQAASIVAELAGAVQCAHLAGVLHRDLKPSNVLLAPAPSGGLPFTPRITDFGLARLTEEATLTTVDGGVFGSLQYMAPEQATGHGQMGPECDVYALGAILYELVTGELPVEADSPPALLAAIPVQPVVPLRRRRVEVPADLDAICLKCLEKRPRDRYGSAGALEVDLRQFLAGETISARLPTPLEQLSRWMRRHPATAIVAATLTTAVLVVLGVLAEANRRQSGLIRELGDVNSELSTANERLETSVETADELRQRAERLRLQSDEERRVAQENLYVSEFRRASMAWRENDLRGLERILDRLDQPEFVSFRGIECDWLRARGARPHREVMRFPGAVYSIVFSHDGTFFAAAGRDSVVRLIRTADSQTLAEWPTRQIEINGLTLAPDEKSLWTTGDDGSLCRWDIAAQKEIFRIAAHAPEQAHELFALPDRQLLVTTGSDGRLCQWDWNTGESRGVLQDSEGGIAAVAMAPSRQSLTCAADGRIRVYDLADGKVTAEWGVTANQKAILISQDGNWVLTSLGDQRVELRSALTGELTGVEKIERTIVRFVSQPDARRVYAINDQGVIFEIELPGMTGDIPPPKRFHLSEQSLCRLVADRIFYATLSPDGKELWTGQSDGRILAWPRTRLKNWATPSVEIPSTRSACFTIGGRTLLVASDAWMREIDSETLQTIRQLELAPNIVTSLCVLPGGEFLTGEQTSDGNGRLTRRRSSDWEIVAEMNLGRVVSAVGTILTDPQLNLLVVGIGGERSLKLSTIHPLELVRPFAIPGSRSGEALDPVHSRFAYAANRFLEVDDTPSRTLLWRQSLPHDGFASMAFSPDGRWLVACGGDRVLRVWEAATGRLRAEMRGHRGLPQFFAITQDGRSLFSADDTGELKLWHLPTGDLLCSMDIPLTTRSDGPPGLLCLAPDDSRLLIVENDRVLRMIPLKLPRD